MGEELIKHERVPDEYLLVIPLVDWHRVVLLKSSSFGIDVRSGANRVIPGPCARFLVGTKMIKVDLDCSLGRRTAVTYASKSQDVSLWPKCDDCRAVR